MGEARRRRMAAQGERTVEDIITGRAPGVFGVLHAVEPGARNGWMPSTAVLLTQPVGLPLCRACSWETPHCWAALFHPPCDQVTLDENFDRLAHALANGMLVELVGDVVSELGDVAISAFPYFGGAPRNMTVPSRAGSVFEHCTACPRLVPHGGRTLH
jgi:hypothetical protein